MNSQPFDHKSDALPTVYPTDKRKFLLVSISSFLHFISAIIYFAYVQGFEVVVAGRKYFAFSKFEKKGRTVTSYCNELMPGWSHDSLGHDWACYTGKKAATVKGPMPSGPKFSSAPSQSLSNILRFETG